MPRMTVFVEGNTKTYYFIFDGCIEDVAGWRKDGLEIIILDEAKEKTILSLAKRLKRAFSIILGAYFTAVVALIPLLWAGAGLLKGFAITTIIGISVGVLITRPAFTDMVKIFESKNVS